MNAYAPHPSLCLSSPLKTLSGQHGRTCSGPPMPTMEGGWDAGHVWVSPGLALPAEVLGLGFSLEGVLCGVHTPTWLQAS